MKKKITATILALSIAGTLTACGGGSSTETAGTETAEQTTEEEPQEETVEEPKEITAESIDNYLKDNIETITDIVVFDEETDPNESLGRPGNYIGKADFWDSRIVDGEVDEDNNSGTIEVFKNDDDCNSRWDYLEELSDPSLGAFGVNQYMFMYDKAIIRADYDFTPSQAQEFVTVLNDYFGTEPTKNTLDE